MKIISFSDWDKMGKDEVPEMKTKTHKQFQKMIEKGEENPYLSIPKPDEVRHMKDRYGNADKQKACWQIKWDLIHCVTGSDCVKVEGNRARDCLRRRDLPKICQSLLNGLQECRVAQISQRSRLRGKRPEGMPFSDAHLDSINGFQGKMQQDPYK